MSVKSGKVAAFLDKLEWSAHFPGLDRRYLGFFECFNQGLFYEAHDVLEDLWLEEKGKDHLYYKGLIQLAGAFVLMQKKRLNPSARLLRLSIKNLSGYAPSHHRLNIVSILKRMEAWLKELEDSQYLRNPLETGGKPGLMLE